MDKTYGPAPTMAAELRARWRTSTGSESSPSRSTRVYPTIGELQWADVKEQALRLCLPVGVAVAKAADEVDRLRIVLAPRPHQGGMRTPPWF